MFRYLLLKRFLTFDNMRIGFLFRIESIKIIPKFIHTIHRADYSLSAILMLAYASNQNPAKQIGITIKT